MELKDIYILTEPFEKGNIYILIGAYTYLIITYKRSSYEVKK